MKTKTTMLALLAAAAPLMSGDYRNLLENPDFGFHCYTNHRQGIAQRFSARNVACWNADGSKDITVTRESHIDRALLPNSFIGNGVKIEPGKRFYQFFTLPEARLVPGEVISLQFYAASGIKASIKQMKIDSETGTWSPLDFGLKDKRTFPKHSRGELVVAKADSVTAGGEGVKLYKIENIAVVGTFSDKNESNSNAVNTVGIEVEFVNESQQAAWVFAPSLTKNAQAAPAVGVLRETPTWYRHLPRTTQKLWKGEPLHIVLMGSSIDRGSANPPLYPYNEDPASPDFKKPIADASDDNFSATKVGRPDLEDHLAQARYYYSYAGRLKRELMVKYDLPADMILINFMAVDGSCIGESHSGLKAYCDLSLPPSPGVNGHRSGKTWQELYPKLFDRPEGPRPDLIIYGSGANEKTDTPNEGAVFEGAIRFIQRNYPDTEFVFCQFQNYGGYTPNPGDMQALALRYQIPFIDFGIIADLLVRTVNRYALVPADGHPQAAAHYLWFKQLEKAFECSDPTLPGIAQLQLPSRMHPNSYGWEGEISAYRKGNPRFFKPNAFILDDTMFNSWGNFTDKESAVFVDGVNKGKPRRSSPNIDIRNSLFRHGDLTLGDRHVVELVAAEAAFTGIDTKICPNRRYIGVESQSWQNNGLPIEKYQSLTGQPYGAMIINLPAGQSLEITTAGTDFSVVWVDVEKGGKLNAELDGKPAFSVPTDQPYKFNDSSTMFMENRKGINGKPFGMHHLKLTATEGPVKVMGVYSYDSRSNRNAERILSGYAAPGDEITFHPPFKARPLVNCGSTLNADKVSANSVTFTGTAGAFYEVRGE